MAIFSALNYYIASIYSLFSFFNAWSCLKWLECFSSNALKSWLKDSTFSSKFYALCISFVVSILALAAIPSWRSNLCVASFKSSWSCYICSSCSLSRNDIDLVSKLRLPSKLCPLAASWVPAFLEYLCNSFIAVFFCTALVFILISSSILENGRLSIKQRSSHSRWQEGLLNDISKLSYAPIKASSFCVFPRGSYSIRLISSCKIPSVFSYSSRTALIGLSFFSNKSCLNWAKFCSCFWNASSLV